MKAKLFSAQAQNQQQNGQNDEEKVSVHSIAEEREGQTPKQKEIKTEESKSKPNEKSEQTEGQRNEASKDKKENQNAKESAVKSNLNQRKKKVKGWSLVKP